MTDNVPSSKETANTGSAAVVHFNDKPNVVIAVDNRIVQNTSALNSFSSKKY